MNTARIMQQNNLNEVQVSAEITASDFPDGYEWAVFSGLEEMLRLFEGMPVDIHCMPEGTVFRNRGRNGVPVPVARIDGRYSDFLIYETAALGFICHSSGISTRAARYRMKSMDALMISFGIRRAHPAICPAIDRAAYIGGMDAVSSIAGAKAIGREPQGTMPHSIVILLGDPAKAFDAYSRAMEGARKIVLVDTRYDEKEEALIAARTVKDLYGIRLDTPHSRRGDFAHIVSEVRWELDVHGYSNVRIFVSGGLKETDIEPLRRAGADGFGIGTAISNAPSIDFALDIVEVNGEAHTKRGKFSGRKEVFRCPACLQYDVLPSGSAAPVCPDCGLKEETLLKKQMAMGKRLTGVEVSECRQLVLDQLETLRRLSA